LKRAEYSTKYFDNQNNFLNEEIDPLTRKVYTKPIPVKITRNIGNLLTSIEITLTEDEKKTLNQLKDFLEKCLVLDPNNRITPEEALKHPFINYDLNKFSVSRNSIKHVF